MEHIKNILQKYIPKSFYKRMLIAYHRALAVIGAVRYGFPGKKLYVITVTGTKGKSSTTEIINSILESAGHKTALSNTIRFKIAEKSRPNKLKMTTPGRFFVQKFLADAVNAGCTHAVLEVSSEAAVQWRHKFMYPNAFVFLNLTPEHIESHGGYENYVQAKLDIGRELSRGKKKDTILVYNKESKEAERFSKLPAHSVHGFTMKDGEPWSEHAQGIVLTWHGEKTQSPLMGAFNIANCIAAATVADAMHVPQDAIKHGIEHLRIINGRAQKIDIGQGFDVVVDYAHTKESLEAIYDAFRHTKRVCILGNTGGGRDTWKRPVMAQTADMHCDEIILTNEDPYDEDPEKIIEDMKPGITSKPLTVEMDRRKAIALGIDKASKWAKKGPASLLITGKGTDPYIMTANGSKIPWSDAQVAEEELKKYMASRSM